MLIREAREEDLFSIAKVQVDCNRSTYSKIMPDKYLDNLSYESKAKEWNEKLFNSKKTEFMYVAETDNGKIVGFASASLHRTNALFEREIHSIYILKEFQRKGIGILLIKAIVIRFTEENVKSMILWTLKDNPSRIFYETLGGKLVDKRIIDRGGKKLQQIAYAWEDLSCIMEANKI